MRGRTGTQQSQTAPSVLKTPLAKKKELLSVYLVKAEKKLTLTEQNVVGVDYLIVLNEIYLMIKQTYKNHVKT